MRLAFGTFTEARSFSAGYTFTWQKCGRRATTLGAWFLGLACRLTEDRTDGEIAPYPPLLK